MTIENNPIIPQDLDAIKSRIFQLHDRQVMLDKEIAILYEVKLKRFRKQAQRNLERFSEDLYFSSRKPRSISGCRKMRPIPPPPKKPFGSLPALTAQKKILTPPWGNTE